MLQWDVKKKTTRGKEILGTVVAFSAADEEQGRKNSLSPANTGYRNKPNSIKLSKP
jgi:hypothetical protein